MKVLIVVGAILALGAAVRMAPNEEIAMLFEKVLEDEDITVPASLYKYRLAIFSLNYIAGNPGDGVNLEMMYDEEELEKQNGAKLIPTLKSELEEELQKRGVDPFGGNPPQFQRPIQVNSAVHQGTCGNCYLHTFIAALELAYYKSSGKRLKFSEQEMTDCYNNGCEGGDYRMVSVMMSYIDKLSLRTAYGDYRSMELTCRGSTTPDALSAIKVEGYIEVPDRDVRKAEAAIVKYGSVMTCMSWGKNNTMPCYLADYQPGQVVDYPEVLDGCDHAVLIVGYTPTYWIVRNSHGRDWGENGYFRIRKGINSCGIEQKMAVLVVSTRESSKQVAPNGCPSNKPNLCTRTHACTSGSGCATPISLLEEEEIVEEIVAEEEEVEEVQEREIRVPSELEKRDEEEEKRFRGGASSNIGKREEDRRRPTNNRGSNPDDDPYMPGKLARLLQKRGLISEEDVIDYFEKNEVVEITKRCADSKPSPWCAGMAATLARVRQDICSDRYVSACQAYCKKCVPPPPPPPKDLYEVQGTCFRPAIANGKVTNYKYMKAGEELNVECNDGFELVGGTSRCLIQDGLTNDDKDGRLLPECIKVDKGAALQGNGASYAGDKNYYSITDPRTGRKIGMECDSWNKDVLRGILTGYKDGNNLLVGNHNYCRNPGGIEPVPFCLGSAAGVGGIYYCFGHPGCETCAGASNDFGDDFCKDPDNTKYCLYTEKSSAGRVANIQERCAATCCAMAGC